MSDIANSASKAVLSKWLARASALLLLVAVPVLALPVLGADLFSIPKTSAAVEQNPLTFDAPALTALKGKLAEGSVAGPARSDALMLTKWRSTFDLFDAFFFGFINPNTGQITVNPNFTGFGSEAALFAELIIELTAILAELTALIEKLTSTSL
jgi:hypothetical protein